MKNMMKKILSLGLALTMAASLAACSGGKEKTWEEELGTAGKLRVGISPDYPPYESYDNNGNIVGFDADMAQAIADYMGVELELVPMEFDTIISAVSAGTIDLGLSCFSYTEKRAESVLFSQTYLTSAQACMTSTSFGIDSMEKLSGGTVGAGSGTTGYDVAMELAEQYGYTAQTGEIAVMAESLKAGALQGIITEKCVVDSYIAANPGTFQCIADDLTVEEIKAISNLNNKALMDKINEAIASIQGDEEAYNELVLHWFG